MAPSSCSTVITTTTETASMPPPTPTLTLIVAATSRTMGIGQNGHLPWPQLKKEMAYFARITKLPPPPSPPPPPTTSSIPTTSTSTHPPSSTSTSTSSPTTTTTSTSTPPPRTPAKTINAVLMGRKTWESIPPRFRPLVGRINVVVSRNPASLDLDPGQKRGTPVLAAGSIREALETLRTRYGDATAAGSEGEWRLGRVFVIGGAEIYRAAMGMAEVGRVLVTRVRAEVECDVFFPVRLGGGGDGSSGWVRRGRKEMGEFVGGGFEGVVPDGEVVEEGGVRWEVELWEREGGRA